jgi:hypothetical protein
MDDFELWSEPTPEQLAKQKEARKRLRERAKKYLKHFRGQLPKLTPKQAGLVVNMLLAAYNGGHNDTLWEWGCEQQIAFQKEHHQRASLSRRGVIARREKSRRWAIRDEFAAAQKAGKIVSVKHLANKHGTSLATAYRAVKTLLKSPKS